MEELTDNPTKSSDIPGEFYGDLSKVLEKHGLEPAVIIEADNMQDLANGIYIVGLTTRAACHT